MTDKPTLVFNLWMLGIGQAMWKCQCGEKRWCSEKRTGRGYLTAAQVAEKTALDHLADKHPLSQLRWNLRSEDATP